MQHVLVNMIIELFRRSWFMHFANHFAALNSSTNSNSFPAHDGAGTCLHVHALSKNVLKHYMKCDPVIEIFLEKHRACGLIRNHRDHRSRHKTGSSLNMQDESNCMNTDLKSFVCFI